MFTCIVFVLDNTYMGFRGERLWLGEKVFCIEFCKGSGLKEDVDSFRLKFKY